MLGYGASHKFKIGDIVEYVGTQNQCYLVPNVGMVENVTDKRVCVRWKERDGSYGPGRTHFIQPDKLIIRESTPEEDK